MLTRYRRNHALYTFILPEQEDGIGYKNFITLVKTPDDETQPETVVNIPVRSRDGYSIAIYKKSIAAGNGAQGAFRFIRDCIRNDFMMVYVNKICDTFAA